MEWTKAEIARRPRRHASTSSPTGKITRSAQPEGQAHAHRRPSRRVKKEVAEQLLAEFPDNAKDIAHVARRRRVQRAALAGARHRQARRRPRARTKSAPITIDTGLLPRAHGSALFTRGQTQALVAVTLGTANDVQRLDIDRRAERDDEVVHAALQLPAVLHRRSAADARHQSAARSATATWPSARCRACCRRSRNSRTRFASSPTSSSRTARRRWRRSAAARSRCSTPACRFAAPSPASRWA